MSRYSVSRKKYQASWKQRHPERTRAYRRKWYNENVPKAREQEMRYRRKLRHEVLQHYGGRCSCCGQMQEEFLSMDHIDGGGNQHRREIGNHLYAWLKKHDFPEGFRVLCHNCNMSRGFFGYCPHEREKRP